MDFFGMGNAMKGMLLNYIAASRSTGRTTMLLDSIKKGDRIVCATSTESERMRRALREKNMHTKVSVMTVDPKDVSQLFDMPPSENRTIFEHTWLEQYYLYRLDALIRDVDELQRRSSLDLTSREETSLQAWSKQRWKI